jgi:hypothetical protein
MSGSLKINKFNAKGLILTLEKEQKLYNIKYLKQKY